MKIIYENKNYLCVEKPIGVISEDGDGGVTDIVSKQISHDVFCVHRLDRGVGGIMLLAKNKKSCAYFSELISKGFFEKEYLAVVTGECPEAGVMEDLLFKDSSKNKSYVVDRMRRGVKKASLEFKRLAVCEGKSLVKIKLHTGRTHQIRVQFSSRKMPLVGDGKYGSGEKCDIALHSFKISFEDESGEVKAFSSLPEKKYPWNLFDTDMEKIGE